MDVLDTRNYRYHSKFYFTLVTSLLITFVTWYSLTHLDFLFSYINHFLSCNKYLYKAFLFVTDFNNAYQVYAHIFTGTKFMGYKKIVPHGSRDKQSLSIFTVSNIFDILGWLTIFVLHKRAHPFLALLAAVHYGTGIVSIFYNSTFQLYYIEDKDEKKGDDDEKKGDDDDKKGDEKCEDDDFSYRAWRIFRTSFVFTDAICRGISIFFF